MDPCGTSETVFLQTHSLFAQFGVNLILNGQKHIQTMFSSPETYAHRILVVTSESTANCLNTFVDERFNFLIINTLTYVRTCFNFVAMC